MYVTLTLNPMGNDLGYNFNLTGNVGSVTPSTATMVQLTDGINIVCDDAATGITVTSIGGCTNSLTIPITLLP